MGKEAKIGLAVLGLLLIVLGGSLWWRFTHWQRGGSASPSASVAGNRSPQPRTPADRPEDAPLAQPTAVSIQAVPLETAIRVPNRAGGWSSTSAPSTPADPPPAVLTIAEARSPSETDAPIAALAELQQRSAPMAVEVQAAEPALEEAMVIPVQATEPLPPSAEAREPAAPRQLSDPFAARAAGASPSPAGAPRPDTPPAPMPQAGAQGWNSSTAQPQGAMPIPSMQTETPRPSAIYQSREGQPAPVSTYQRFAGDDGAAAYAGQPMAVAAEPATMLTSGADPGAGAAALQPDGTYVVEPNDNYWRISEKFYGTGAYFKALAEHNRKRVARPDRLQVGDVIEIPSDADLQANYGDLCPEPSHLVVGQGGATPVSYTAGGRVYVVEEGDTLFDIARHELGSPARWKEVYDLNRGQLSEDFNHLRPGTQLVLPADGSSQPQPAGTLTRRPGSVY